MSDSTVTDHLEPPDNEASAGASPAPAVEDIDTLGSHQAVNGNEAVKNTKPSPPPPFEHVKTPSQPSTNGVEQVLNRMDDKTESAQAKADFFDLGAALQSLKTGTSAVEAMAPLKGVMSVLEGVVAIHPFIAIAVLPFQAVLKLELNRRKNDRRIITLISQIADMMQHLRELPSEKLEESQNAHFKDILESMKDGISDCGNSIDLYYKSKLIGRILRSLKWQEKFEEFADQFVKLKEDLRSRLLVVTHLTTMGTHKIVERMEGNLNDILALLRGSTEHELNIARYLNQRGGPMNLLQDDATLSDLIKKVERVENGRTVRFEDSGGGSVDGKSGGSQYPPRPRPQRRDSGRSNRWLEESNYVIPSTIGRPRHNNASRPRSGSVYVPSPVTYSPAPIVYGSTPAVYTSPTPYLPYSPRPSTQQISLTQAATTTTSRPQGWGSAATNGLGLDDMPSNDSPYVVRPASPGLYQITEEAAPMYTTPTASEPRALPRRVLAIQSGAYIPASGSIPAQVAQVVENDITEPDGSVRTGLLDLYRFEIGRTLDTELSVLLEENQQNWEVVLSFELSKLATGIKAHIDRAAMGVVGAVSENSYQKITDPDLSQIWKAEKWRISVPAEHFIQGVYDALQQNVPESEKWAIDFLLASNRHSLLRAVDCDYSGLVSFIEANAFTDAKPPGQSLLVWCAVRAVSWFYEASECAQQISDARKKIAALLDQFPISGGPRQLREIITEAVRDIDAKIASEFEGVLLAHLTILKHRTSEIKHIPPLMKLLKEAFAGRKEAMASNLEAVRWDILSQDTLYAVIKGAPIENNILLLVLLVITRLVDYLVDTNLGASAPRRDRTVVQRIFTASEALLQFSAAIDDRVFSLTVSFPERPIEQYAFGLFAKWTRQDSQDRPAEPEMPAISLNPGIEPRAPLSAPAESVTAATTSPVNDASAQAAEPVEPQSDNVVDVGNSNPPPTPPRNAPSPSEEPAIPGLRYSGVPRPRSPALIPVMSRTPTIIFPGTAGPMPTPLVSDARSPQNLHPFSRPTNNISRIFGLPQFREFTVMRDVIKFSELFGRDVDAVSLPQAVHDRDVELHEWEAFIAAVRLAVQMDATLRLTIRQRGRAAKVVVDAWNHHFFMSRSVFFRLTKERRVRRSHKRHHISSDSESDSVSSISSAEDDESGSDDQYGSHAGSRRRSRRRREDRAKYSYRLTCGPVAVPPAAPAYSHSSYGTRSSHDHR